MINATCLPSAQSYDNTNNKMQLETADFAPSAAIWRHGRKTCIVFDSDYSHHYIQNSVIHKTKVHNVPHCHQRRTELLPQVTCMENLVKFGRVVFVLRYVSRETNKQTRWSQYFAPRPGGGGVWSLLRYNVQFIKLCYLRESNFLKYWHY